MISLKEHSGSGYELARRFDKSIGFFWSATHQQIYRVLKRMDEAGWVVGEAIAQDGRPDKTVYRVSADGEAELARWIAEPTEIVPLRNELAVKLRGAAYGDRDALCKEVMRHRDQHAERLALFRRIESHDFPAPDQLSGTALHQYLVLRAGIRADEGYIEWCREILDVLQPSTERSTDR